MKYLNKVTPEVYKQIKVLIRALPQCPKLDKHGKPVFQVDGKRVSGKDVPAGTKINGQDPDPKGIYTHEQRKMVYLNHEVELVEAYKTMGQRGIERYTEEMRRYEAEVNRLKEEAKQLTNVQSQKTTS